MRDPARIGRFVVEIGTLWRRKCPDWRFGQLMANFFEACGDPFYWEEDVFLAKLKKYLESLN